MDLARAASIVPMHACGWGERTIAAQACPSRWKSSLKRPRPLTRRASSVRTRGLPIDWKLAGSMRMLPSFIAGFGFRLALGRKLTELLNLMKRAHPEEPHWYLATIGSDTGVRGRGFGQALMRSRLRRCDAEYAPAYLESSKPENIPYYQRFGFTVTGEIVLPDGPTLWPMWRAPRLGSV